MAKLRTGYLILRGKKFHACWTVAGKKFRRSTGTGDERKAKAKLAEIMEPFLIEDETKTLQNIKARIEGGTEQLARIHDERHPPMTIAQAWNIFAASTERPDSGPRTLADYEASFTTFRKWMEKEHSDVVAMRDVTPEIAAAYAQHLSAYGITASTFNKAINALSLVCRTLSGPAKLTGNPWASIKRRKIVSQSHREMTIDELRSICRTAEGELALLFALGIYTGLRLVDCCTLKWGEVDLHRNVIRRIPVKMARRDPKRALVIIPLHPGLRDMLAQTPTADRKGFVLPDTAATYERGVSYVTKTIQQHFSNCGIQTTREMNGRKRVVVEVGFHSLRHSFVSMCRDRNTPLSVVQAIVGHTSPAMTQHYTHSSEDAARLAVTSLPSVMGEDTKGQNLLPAPTPAASLKAGIAKIEDMTAKTWGKARVAALADLRTALAEIEGTSTA